MSPLTRTEILRFEKLFGMSTGYVLDFSNQTFSEFFSEYGIDIYDVKYNYGTKSKANRLRKFIMSEPDSIVGMILDTLLDHWMEIQEQLNGLDGKEKRIYEECRNIVKRLKSGNTGDLIIPDDVAINDDKGFSILVQEINDDIIKGLPECALDRLHTYSVKYFRHLCNKHEITFKTDEPLHSLVGKYSTHLKNKGLAESSMTYKIIRSSIGIFDDYNNVRNKKSLAHDNPLLSTEEATLICEYVKLLIRFIDSVEKGIN